MQTPSLTLTPFFPLRSLASINNLSAKDALAGWLALTPEDMAICRKLRYQTWATYHRAEKHDAILIANLSDATHLTPAQKLECLAFSRP